jgi:NAD(P)-dependent dehydrogenase (short-subunit alcohol dehydrogenase family)
MQAIPQVTPMVEAARGGRGCFAFISSAMAQIAGASTSRGWVYRASKTALNMVVASAQHDYPKAIMVALSPGWVQTDMGGQEAPLTVVQSVTGMRATLAGLTPAHKGAFLNYDGQPFTSW